MGDGSVLKFVWVEVFVDDSFGLLMICDILLELEKFGCDLCFSFVIVSFVDGVEDIKDLCFGMVLEGMVMNVVVFGVFVDIGVY